MVFNNEINHLKLWCIHKAESYQQKYAGYGGICYVGYQVAYEMEFKLSKVLVRKEGLGKRRSNKDWYSNQGVFGRLFYTPKYPLFNVDITAQNHPYKGVILKIISSVANEKWAG